MTLSIARADLDDEAVQALVAAHRAHAFDATPPENVFALDKNALRAPDLEVYAAREGTSVVGLGALRHLADGDGEIKSFHVAQAARGRGTARQIRAFLESRAVELGMPRLWLETGSMEAFTASRGLYLKAGFAVCDAFGDYPSHPGSTFMMKAL